MLAKQLPSNLRRNPVNLSLFKLFVGTILKIYLPNILIFIYYKGFTRKTFLFDRYAYDFIDRLDNSNPVHRILNYLFSIFPSPNHIIFLDIEPEIAYKRKKEFDVPFLEKKQRLLKIATAKLCEKKLIHVDPVEDLVLKKYPFEIRKILKSGFDL